MVGLYRWSGDFGAGYASLTPPVTRLVACSGPCPEQTPVARLLPPRRTDVVVSLYRWSGDFEARALDRLCRFTVSRVVRGGASNRRRSPDCYRPAAIFFVPPERGEWGARGNLTYEVTAARHRPSPDMLSPARRCGFGFRLPSSDF